MYPPQEDRRRDVAGRTDVRRYRSVGHNIWVADNGAIMITSANGATVCLDKPGLDGPDDRTGDGQRCFDALLASLDGVVSASIDAPSDPMGEWYLDLEMEGFSTSVAWEA